MNYEGRLERASRKQGARFLEYRPETGSWVFEVSTSRFTLKKKKLARRDIDQLVAVATQPVVLCFGFVEHQAVVLVSSCPL